MFRSAYSHRDEELHQGIVFEEPSLTDQSQYKDTDINNIVRRYQTTGLLDSPGSVPFETLQYGDATLLPDYQTALDLVNSVQTEFASMPSEIREKFGHDPMQLLEALQDPTKKTMLQDIGLLSKDEVQLPKVESQPILKDEVPPVKATELK
ncbi:putative VP3 [Microvirus sp.]|nr:putative VP3 [Microvirus sp.]